MAQNMVKYDFFMISDNEDGVLSNICNLFTSRGFSVECVSAQPLNIEKTLSSIKLSAFLPEEKIQNIYHKLMQVVAIRSVEIYKLERIV